MGYIIPDGDDNRLRSNPDTGADVITQVRQNHQFILITGPECADGYTWWYIDYGAFEGWTAEGDDEEYFIEPISVDIDNVELLNGGEGQTTGAVMNGGDMQVEYYCQTYGYGGRVQVVDGDGYWRCSNGGHTLTANDFTQICRDTYDNRAVALQIGNDYTPAYNWRCVRVR